MVSLKQNTRKTRLCIDWLMKSDQRLAGILLGISPRSNGSVFANSVFMVTL